MNIAVTGATGFLGRYIVNMFLQRGDRCHCWHQPTSDRGGFWRDGAQISWVEGGLHEPDSIAPLIEGVDAVVHAAVHRPPGAAGHRGADSSVSDFAQVNIMGSLQLIEQAHRSNIGRFVFISSGSVHDLILDDRALDETHPLWPLSHYGAYKAAVEKFVHSFGLPHHPSPDAAPTHRHLRAKDVWGICALRPVGIYGVRRPIEAGKWYGIVQRVLRDEPVDDSSGGKEVHVEDVALAVDLLLRADPAVIGGQSYNCYDQYVAAQDVAQIAIDLTGSRSQIHRRNRGPRHQISTQKIRALGMVFGGKKRLEAYVGQLVEAP